MKKAFFIMAAAVMLASCGGDKGDKIQYLPFQEEENGNWGMINTDGDVLFTGEFKQQPTLVMNDRFFVKNSDDKWELYEAGEKPKQVGDAQYEQAGAFIEDVAPVVVKGQKIQFIDKTGKVKFTLDNVNGKPVTECTNFSDGVAIIKVDKYYGAINTSGKVIIQPEYAKLFPASDGKIVGAHKKYVGKEAKKIMLTVFSTSGKQISEIPMKKFKDADGKFYDGAMVVEEEDADGHTIRGLIDEKGEYIVKPSSKTKSITQIFDKKFIFSDGDNYGIMDFNGEIIIRAKYKQLVYMNYDGVFAAVKNDNSTGIVLINENDEELSKDEYTSVLPFSGGNCTFVRDNSGDWILVNEKGEDQKIKTDIYDIANDEFGDETFESQYFDVEAFVNGLDLQANSIMGVSVTQTPEQVVRAIDIAALSHPDVVGADGYTYSQSVNKDVEVNGIYVKLGAQFAEPIATYKENPNGEGQNVFVDSLRPTDIGIIINEEGLLKDKMSDLTAALIKKVKTLGSVVGENKYGVKVKAGQCGYFVGRVGDGIVIALFDYKYSDHYDLDYLLSSNGDSNNAPETDDYGEGDYDEDYGELESPPADDMY